MKLTLFALFCLEATLAATPSKAVLEDWEAWKQQHGMDYPTKSHESFRMKIWMENRAVIEKHNKEFDQGVHTFQLGLNEFSDQSSHEFFSMFNGYLPRPKEEENGANAADKVGRIPPILPHSVDWRNKGAVTRHVENQGPCRAGWAFATVGAVEAANVIQAKKKFPGSFISSLSELQLIDCVYHHKSCKEGGHREDAFDYIKEHGLAKGTNYAYSDPMFDTDDTYNQTTQCHDDRMKPWDIGARIKGRHTIQEGNEDELKEAVALKGPVTVAIDAHGYKFQHHTTGVYSDSSCGNRRHDLTHTVLVVGYGRENNQDYWLIKNSWGTDWGEKGYVKLARGKNMCGVATHAVYPVM